MGKGTMGSVDVNNGTSDDSSNDMYMGMASTSSDDQTTSTSYPFYVELDSSENLMLGQHVYIERDIGQDEKKMVCGSVITIFWTQIPMNRMYGQPAIRTDWRSVM